MRISILVCTFVFAFLFKTNAMITDLHRCEKHFVMVQVLTKPRISVTQFPKQNQVVFDVNWKSKKIEMKQGDVYKGMVLKSPLRITEKMDPQQFFKAVYSAFGKPCRCMEGWCNSGIVYPSEVLFLKKNSMITKALKGETPFFLVKVQDLNILKFSETIIFDKIRKGKILNINRKEKCKGVHLQKGLCLSCNMSNAIFLETICKAVNQPCTFVEGFYHCDYSYEH